jgi:hypothetical protein
MELRDFIKKFSSDNYDTSDISELERRFPSALKNFANRICEKQRNGCAELIGDFDKQASETLHQVLSAIITEVVSSQMFAAKYGEDIKIQ